MVRVLCELASIWALTLSVHLPTAVITSLSLHSYRRNHTETQKCAHTAIKKMTWFKAPCWYTYPFPGTNKAYEEFKPHSCIYRKALTVCCSRINLPHMCHRLSLFSKIPKTAQTHCCTALTQQIMLNSMCIVVLGLQGPHRLIHSFCL